MAETVETVEIQDGRHMHFKIFEKEKLFSTFII